MRVEICDWNGQAYTITSKNASLVGNWFAEHAAALMTNDNRCYVQINIWPQDELEDRAIGQPAPARLTQDGLLHFADVILQASQRLAELESAKLS